MQMRTGFVGLLLAIGLSLPSGALAEQPRDWIVGARDEGTYLSLDFLIGAVQATLEDDTKIYGNANQFTARARGLAALPFGQAALGFDLRVLMLSFGMDVGGQYTWRGMTCEQGVECHRKQLRIIEAAGEFQEEAFPYWEGRGRLALPFNDYVLFLADSAFRVSGAPDNFYDYQNAIMRDGDLLTTNVTLFLKNKDWGAFAPTLQHYNYSVYGDTINQINFGFSLLTRAGLVQRDDLLIFRMMFHDPDMLGGDNVADSYGNYRILRGPLTLLLAYRSMITL